MLRVTHLGRCLAMTAAAAVLAGCGSSGAGGAADDAQSEADASASAEAKKDAEAEASADAAALEALAEAKQLHSECTDLTQGLRSELEELNSRLGVGMQYDAYGERVGGARVEYDRLLKDIKRPAFDAGECLDSATGLETALIAYSNAFDTWGTCIEDYYCSIDDAAVDTKMQASWSKATKALTKSDRELRLLRRP